MNNEQEFINITVGSFLKEEFLEPLYLTQNELARLIGVDNTRINQIINNKRGITVDTDIRLCKLFGMSEGFFLKVQESIERRELKRTKKIEFDSIIPFDMKKYA